MTAVQKAMIIKCMSMEDVNLLGTCTWKRVIMRTLIYVSNCNISRNKIKCHHGYNMYIYNIYVLIHSIIKYFFVSKYK